jgi:GT2 family glycosyltransferase
VIPVVIVPTLNRPDLLDKMLLSIDHPVGGVIIIDNGDVVGALPDLPFEVRVIAPGYNIGVGASWNFGMKITPAAPWWLITNDDLEFGPGDLARTEAAVDPGAAALYYMLGMACFGVTFHALRAVGFFDENIHPAYNEDLDWGRRADLAGVIKVQAGFTGTHVGSAAIYSDPALRVANGYTHASNDRYYAAKWGGPKQGGETFATPFNRGGHVGDWRLDIARLRENAWPTKPR